MKTVIFPLFVVLAAFGWNIPAHAQGQVVECGTALATEMDVQPGGQSADYCNFHDRRLDYAQNRKDLRNQIDQRRENYHAPMQQAHDNYKHAVEEHYASEENKPVTLMPARNSSEKSSYDMSPNEIK